MTQLSRLDLANRNAIHFAMFQHSLHIIVSALFAGSALMTAVADDLVQRANDYSAQHLAATLWAFAKLETIARPGMIQACTVMPIVAPDCIMCALLWLQTLVTKAI